MAKLPTDADTLKARAVSEARTIMRAEGESGVKARVIATRLGVSVGTIYNLFGSLDALFLAVQAEIHDALHERVSSALEEAKREAADIEGQMRALAGAYLAFVTENSALWSAVLSHDRRSTDTPPDWYRQKERTLLRVISETMAELSGSRPEAERDIAARALWAAVHGIVTNSVARGRLLAPEEEVRAQLDFIVRAVTSRLKEPHRPYAFRAL